MKKTLSKKIYEFLLNRFFVHIQIKVKKKKKCYKCLDIEHSSKKSNVFCKDKSMTIKEQVIVKLAAIDMKWDDTSLEEYKSDAEKDSRSRFSFSDDSKN